MRIISVITALFFFNVMAYSQTEVKLFPDKLNIQPFTANALEPRMGVLFHVNNNELRLDIGSSMDLVNFSLSEKENLSIGADFFTYTLLRGEKDFHFPVDAVDYLFGVNAGYKKTIEDGEYGLRFRLSHISAHFADGHYDFKNLIWRDNQNPRVYSREFLEFIPFYRMNNLRVYAGLTYIFHIDPTYLGKYNYQAGFDYFLKNKLFNYVTPFAAYDIKMVKIRKYSAENTFNLGIKVGHPEGRGFSLYYSYYSGMSMHGEYFDYLKSYNAIGFNLDL
ncbi:MAG: DUF1207 domain-containing protein [Ignavibacteria bacterium]|jgi:hypothetical protein|nr:DUF1207 domain-containing protein [Ignavibacteria bacterium]MCU7511875.1 DUF1207 domain-containing protein [Ignavibacteria bacterium]MCU7522999.1 DUF1207 domain-containing protein [Ignavibacteria bacterium]